MNLEGKVAFISGSSRGIGYYIAKLFALNGAKVVICGSSFESASKAALKLREDINIDEDKIFPVGLDMRDKEQIKDSVECVIKKWKRIDILVNNAGITSNQPFLESTDEDFENMFKINFFGLVTLTRSVALHMKDYGGSIINTGSMVGVYGGYNQAEYASSKSAICGFTKSLAKELGQYKIRVNVVAPGVVKTDMMDDFVSLEMANKLSAMTPLGRIGAVEDLAGAYLYLASDMSKFTTGTIIRVDGGLVM